MALEIRTDCEKLVRILTLTDCHTISMDNVYVVNFNINVIGIMTAIIQIVFIFLEPKNKATK